MIYAPHFKLRAFDTLTDDAKITALVQLLEALTGVNEAWLREHPYAPYRQKAAMLRAGTLPTNPVDLLAQVPDPPRTQVMQQLMMQNDPNALEAYAAQLQAQYPAAAAALRLKEAVLRGQAPEVAPPTPGSATPTPPAVPPTAPPFVPMPVAPPIAPQPAPAAISIPALTIPLPTIIPSITPSDIPSVAPTPIAPTPTAPATPTITPPFVNGLDAGMPPEVQKAVMGALTTESDPAKLEGFASAIQAQYPIASGLLKAKAEALRLMQNVPAIPLVPPMNPVIVPSAPPSIATNGTYKVLSGDFPIKISQKLTGDPSRWHELIAANPQKKVGADGNFVTLLPGEILTLPASWSSAPKPNAINVPAIPALQLPLNVPAALSSIAAAAGTTYKVLAGDFPIKIAQKLTGNGNRWHELVSANPQKKTGADGNFASLMPGEVLQLPVSWTPAGGLLAAHA